MHRCKDTHRDVSSPKVLVREDGIIGFIDREDTTSWQVKPHNPFWTHEIEKFFELLPDTIEVEHLRRSLSIQYIT